VRAGHACGPAAAAGVYERGQLQVRETGVTTLLEIGQLCS
jgi:hypothetical protein